MHIFTPGPLLA